LLLEAGALDRASTRGISIGIQLAHWNSGDTMVDEAHIQEHVLDDMAPELPSLQIEQYFG